MRVSKRIGAPVEVVWKILIDTRLWSVWGPSVERVECPQRWISAGVKGRLKTAVGLWVPFEITVFEEPLYWDWKVAGIPATGHRLTAKGANNCELAFEIPCGAFLYAPICRRAAGNISRLATEKKASSLD